MPIYIGKSGGSNILGLTRTNPQQQYVYDDTIFHSSLPYAEILEYETSSYSNEQELLYYADGWSQQSNYKRTAQNEYLKYQAFAIPTQVQNYLANSDKAMMVFIYWSDGQWEHVPPVRAFFTEPVGQMGGKFIGPGTGGNGDKNIYRQALDSRSHYFELSKYSNIYRVFPKTTTTKYTTTSTGGGAYLQQIHSSVYQLKVVFWVLDGIDVTNSTISVSPRNPNNTGEIKISNTNFIVAGVEQLDKKYLGIIKNMPIGGGDFYSPVCQSMIMPGSMTYTNSDIFSIGNIHTLAFDTYNWNAGAYGSPLSTTNSSGEWCYLNTSIKAGRTISTNSGSDVQGLVPYARVPTGGPWQVRWPTPTISGTNTVMNRQFQRIDQGNNVGSSLTGNIAALAKLSGREFQNQGVKIDSRVPNIAIGGRELFGPSVPIAQRLGPTMVFRLPSCYMSPYNNTPNINLLHQTDGVVYTQSVSNTSDTFLLSLGAFRDSVSQMYGPILTSLRVGLSTFYRLKRTDQDSVMGQTIQSFVPFAGSGAPGYDVNPYIQNYGQCPTYSDRIPRNITAINLPVGSKYILQNYDVILSAYFGGYNVERSDYDGYKGLYVYLYRSSPTTIELRIQGYMRMGSRSWAGDQETISELSTENTVLLAQVL